MKATENSCVAEYVYAVVKPILVEVLIGWLVLEIVTNVDGRKGTCLCLGGLLNSIQELELVRPVYLEAEGSGGEEGNGRREDGDP